MVSRVLVLRIEADLYLEYMGIFLRVIIVLFAYCFSRFTSDCIDRLVISIAIASCACFGAWVTVRESFNLNDSAVQILSNAACPIES